MRILLLLAILGAGAYFYFFYYKKQSSVSVGPVSITPADIKSAGSSVVKATSDVINSVLPPQSDIKKNDSIVTPQGIFINTNKADMIQEQQKQIDVAVIANSGKDINNLYSNDSNIR